ELLRKEIAGVPAWRVRAVGSVQHDAQVDAGEVGGGAVVQRQAEVVARLVIVGLAELLLQGRGIDARIARLVTAVHYQRGDTVTNERELVAADEADFFGRELRAQLVALRTRRVSRQRPESRVLAAERHEIAHRHE